MRQIDREHESKSEKYEIFHFVNLDSQEMVYEIHEFDTDTIFFSQIHSQIRIADEILLWFDA
jgi:hypothetical protein